MIRVVADNLTEIEKKILEEGRESTDAWIRVQLDPNSPQFSDALQDRMAGEMPTTEEILALKAKGKWPE